jgi:hypothetical protein
MANLITTESVTDLGNSIQKLELNRPLLCSSDVVENLAVINCACRRRQRNEHTASKSRYVQHTGSTQSMHKGCTETESIKMVVVMRFLGQEESFETNTLIVYGI